MPSQSVLEECGRACPDDDVVRGTYEMLAQSPTEEVVIGHGIRIVARLARHRLEYARGGPEERVDGEGSRLEGFRRCLAKRLVLMPYPAHNALEFVVLTRMQIAIGDFATPDVILVTAKLCSRSGCISSEMNPLNSR
jgi:hypothetical protein